VEPQRQGHPHSPVMCLPSTAPGGGGCRACRSCAIQRCSVEFEEAWSNTSDVDQVTDTAE